MNKAAEVYTEVLMSRTSEIVWSSIVNTLVIDSRTSKMTVEELDQVFHWHSLTQNKSDSRRIVAFRAIDYRASLGDGTSIVERVIVNLEVLYYDQEVNFYRHYHLQKWALVCDPSSLKVLNSDQAVSAALPNILRPFAARILRKVNRFFHLWYGEDLVKSQSVNVDDLVFVLGGSLD